MAPPKIVDVDRNRLRVVDVERERLLGVEDADRESSAGTELREGVIVALERGVVLFELGVRRPSLDVLERWKLEGGGRNTSLSLSSSRGGFDCLLLLVMKSKTCEARCGVEGSGFL